MLKLVLGIVALVAVQFAFVTYTMLLTSSNELMDDLAVSQPVLPVKSDRIEDSAENVTKPETVLAPVQARNTKANRPTPIVVPEPNAKRVASPEPRISKPAFIPERVDTTSASEFKTVVIRYNRNPPVSDCPESREVPKAKKRSYLAKASPVIKKPWDWLKAIGSKLN